jgi:hypothetical protein
MKYKLRSIMTVTALVALAVSVSASAANAAIQYEWNVKGSALKSGSSKGFTAKNKGTGIYHLNFTVPVYTLEVELESNKLGFENGVILGGKPGGIEGRMVFESLQVVKPRGCTLSETLGIIETNVLKAEAVESAEAGKGTGKTETLFAPKTGAVLAELGLVNREGEFCALNGLKGKIEGNLLMEVTPQNAEEKVGQLKFEAKSSEYVNSKGEVKKAALGVALEIGAFKSNAPVSLTGGDAEMELVSKEVFGAF